MTSSWQASSVATSIKMTWIPTIRRQTLSKGHFKCCFKPRQWRSPSRMPTQGAWKITSTSDHNITEYTISAGLWLQKLDDVRWMKGFPLHSPVYFKLMNTKLKNACFFFSKTQKNATSNSQRCDSRDKTSPLNWGMNPELGGEVKNTFCSLWHGPVEWLRYGDVHPWLMWRMRFTHGKTPWASRKVPLRCGCLQIALDGSCLSNWTSSMDFYLLHARSMLQKRYIFFWCCKTVTVLIMYAAIKPSSSQLIRTDRCPFLQTSGGLKKRLFQRRWRTSCWNLALV